MKHLQLDKQAFLDNFWQKKPCLFRAVFKDIDDILDEHELAGLAQEEELDSRIIRLHEQQWFHSAGPFEDFEPHCVGDWSLLVQGLENCVPEAQELLNEFQFIPAWRIDDLMVSFSVPGAGVGPHLDQYDVFIIQGKGSRRWQVGLPGEYEELLPHPNIRQIKGFEAVIDEVLQPGDMLYIPAGHPHNGEALENCINYSVGFRASTQNELLSSFCDHLLDNNIEGLRYTDKDVVNRGFSTELRHNEKQKFKQLMLDMVESNHFDNWLGKHLTEAHKFVPWFPEEPVTTEQILALVNNGQFFEKAPGLRVLHYELDETAPEFQVFINESLYHFETKQQKVILELMNSQKWCNKQELNYDISSHFIHSLTTLINEGYWIISE